MLSGPIVVPYNIARANANEKTTVSTRRGPPPYLLGTTIAGVLAQPYLQFWWRSRAEMTPESELL